MKKIVYLMVVLVIAGAASATLITYDGQNVEIEGTVGSGSSQTMVVIDWLSGVTQSHAWLYKYDGIKEVADAYNAIEADFVTFAWSNAPFVTQLDYNDGVDNHVESSEGWSSFWNMDTGVWATNGVGVMDQVLLNNGWSGAVVDDYDWGDVPPTVPVPEPATLALLGVGFFLTRKRK